MKDLEEIRQSQINTAMKSSEHLKEWLERSGRRWLVFDSLDLVDSLVFPDGINLLMSIINAYHLYRQTQPSGRRRVMKSLLPGQNVEVSIMKGEHLEKEELDRLIRYLIIQITERDPTWELSNPPL